MSSTVFAGKYRLIQVLPSPEKIRHLVAVCPSPAQDTLVLLNEIVDRDLMNEYLPGLFSAFQGQRALPDYLDCFAEDRKFYAVFVYTDAMPLLDYLKRQKLGFAYRVLIARNLLEKLTGNYHAPPMLRSAMIQPENIVMRENALYFNYRIFPTRAGQNFDDAAIFTGLGALLQAMFPTAEVRRNRRLGIILEKCKKNIYLSLGELIRDLDGVSGAWQKGDRFAEKIAKQKPVMRRWLLRAMIFACFIGVFWAARSFLRESDPAPSAQQAVQRIGTVDVAPLAAGGEEDSRIVWIGEIPQFHLSKGGTAAAALDGQGELYPIAWGDTLRAITLRRYGSADYVNALSAYNELISKDLIFAGKTLRLPPKDTLSRMAEP